MTAYIRRTASRNRALLYTILAALIITGALFALSRAFGSTPTRQLESISRPLPGSLGPVTASGSLTASSQTVICPVGDQGTTYVQVTGTWSGTLTFKGTVDGSTYVTIHANSLATDTLVTSTTGNGIFVLGGGFSDVEVAATSFASGTAVVTMRGCPAGAASVAVSAVGGGGGGGGSIAASVSVADGADTALGTTTDAAVQGDNAGTAMAKLRGLNKSIAAGIGISSLPALAAGSNAIGTVGVTSLPALPTGSNGIGTVGVTSLPALAAGSNVIGGVTQSGTWNATINTALPAGSNAIGSVTLGAAVPAGSNTIGTVNVGTPLPAAAALADATATPTLSAIQSYPAIYNGTTWDGLRDSLGATNGTKGSLAAGLMVFDTVDAQNKRVNSIASAIAGGLTGKNVEAVGGMLYDGSVFRYTKGNTDGSLPVGGYTLMIQTSPTITATSYSAGQDIGGAISFSGATRLSAGSGVIQSVGISDKAKQSAAIDLIFFNAAPSAPTDHATFNPSSSDIAKIIGIVSVTASNYSAFSANSTAFVGNIGLPFTLTSGTTLNCVAVSRGTPTYASTSDLQISCGIAAD